MDFDHELTVDVSYEDLQEAVERLGVHHLSPTTGSVEVLLTGASNAVAGYRVLGTQMSLLGWLRVLCEGDNTMALDEYTQAIIEGRLKAL